MHCGSLSACASDNSCLKMAAYGKDEFYRGSDFSEFSESDAESVSISDASLGSDDDEYILRYCVCGLRTSTDMIACDNGGCKIEWFQYPEVPEYVSFVNR